MTFYFALEEHLTQIIQMDQSDNFVVSDCNGVQSQASEHPLQSVFHPGFWISSPLSTESTTTYCQDIEFVISEQLVIAAAAAGEGECAPKYV